MFITNNKRIGTCYLEFQFCKNDKPIKLGKVDVDIIDNWKWDSLLVLDDDLMNFINCMEKFLNVLYFQMAKLDFSLWNKLLW